MLGNTWMMIAVFTLSSTMVGSGLADAQTKAQLSAEVQFAREVVKLRPVQPSKRFSPGLLACWTKIKGGSGRFRVTHVWRHDEKTVWRRSVQARGKAWVTWSRFRVTAGSWRVDVIDADGKVIGSGRFVVDKAAQGAAR